MRAPEITVFHPQCAVGGIRRSKTTPFNFWVASLLLKAVNGERTNPVTSNLTAAIDPKMKSLMMETDGRYENFGSG